MAVDSQICGLIDALADFQVKIMEAINGRFAALRRLANLLEAAGDLTGFIPDISKLIPLSKIDTRIYDEMRVNCPFLNLPPADLNAEQFLGELRAQVNAAYGRLLGQINLHPFSILGKLQEKFDAFQARINSEALKGSDFLRCLQSICQAESAVKSLISRPAKSIIDTAETYYKNQIVGQGQLLGGAAQAKVNDIQNVGKGVKDLMDVSQFGEASSTIGL
jgi:hypothetical protein